MESEAYLKVASDLFIAAHLPALRERGLSGEELTAACVRGVGRVYADLVHGWSKARDERIKELNPGNDLVG